MSRLRRWAPIPLAKLRLSLLGAPGDSFCRAGVLGPVEAGGDSELLLEGNAQVLHVIEARPPRDRGQGQFRFREQAPDTLQLKREDLLVRGSANELHEAVFQ